MSIDAVIEGILVAEGGYVNHKDDRGGATNYGITELVAKQNGYHGTMKDLPRSFAKQVYLNQYWLVPRFNQVAVLSPAVAEELCDAGVNMGPSFASTALQQALNLLNRQGSDYSEITEDGKIGPGTLAALAAYLLKRGKAGEEVLMKAIVIMRGARYLAICKNNPTQESFLFGWLSNRVHFK